jgi:DNA-binding FadR family transcriptional regulator
VGGPAHAQITDELRRLIVTGKLEPGRKLPNETDLARLLNVSRSTVREALRTLSSQRLITTRRGVHGGTFISQPDAGQLGDLLSSGLDVLSGPHGTLTMEHLLEARELIEVPAARLAAARRTDDHIAMMERQLSDDPDLQVDAKMHTRFHQAVYAACDNDLITLMARPISAVLSVRFLTAQTPEFWSTVVQEHRQMAEAIAAGNGEAAAAAAATHLATIGPAYEQLGNSGIDEPPPP